MSRQLGLFGMPAVALREPVVRVDVPAWLRVGPSSWSFPGWPVWAGSPGEALLAREGLRALASHPCIKTVGVDRSYYRPLGVEQWREYAEQVPEGFRFLVKGPEEALVGTWPKHARYGARAGQPSERFLDGAWVAEVAVGPMLAGLGSKVGVFLLQFAPQGFAAGWERRLEGMLGRLPAGPVYAVEARNPAVATRELAARVRGAGAVMCLNRWGDMPPLAVLAERWEVWRDRARVVRWMMPTGGDYGALEAEWAPFSRVQRADDAGVRAVLDVVRGAEEAWVIADNKAEGCGIRTCERVGMAAAGVDGWEGVR